MTSTTTPTSARSPSRSGAPARGPRDLAYLKVSSGIGAGLMVGGRPYRGAGGDRGRDRPHLSDRRGRLRSAAVAAAAAWRPWPRRGDRSTPAWSASPGDAGARRLSEFALAADGDPAGARSPTPAATSAVAVADLCNLFNPERVIVGGDLGAARRDRCSTRLRGEPAALRHAPPRPTTSRSSPACSASEPRCSAPCLALVTVGPARLRRPTGRRPRATTTVAQEGAQRSDRAIARELPR